MKFENLKLKVDCVCGRCLKHFTEEITVPFGERIFYIDQPSEVEDCFDLYLVDKKNLTVDPTEMFRQEIILHYPLNPVCSKSCKGIAYKKEEISVEHKPLAQLKDLLK